VIAGNVHGDRQCPTLKGRAGRPAVNADKVDMVREAFRRSPGKSYRRASRELNIPRPTMQKILHSRLKLNAF
jgi:hypothetical protein